MADVDLVSVIFVKTDPLHHLHSCFFFSTMSIYSIRFTISLFFHYYFPRLYCTTENNRDLQRLVYKESVICCRSLLISGFFTHVPVHHYCVACYSTYFFLIFSGVLLGLLGQIKHCSWDRCYRTNQTACIQWRGEHRYIYMAECSFITLWFFCAIKCLLY